MIQSNSETSSPCNDSMSPRDRAIYQLRPLFPELFAGMDNYCLSANEKEGINGKYSFAFGPDYIHSKDFCARYDIDTQKNKYHLIFDHSLYINADSYQELLEKRALAFKGKFHYIRLPEFQAKIFLSPIGLEYEAHGANGFARGAFTPDTAANHFSTFCGKQLLSSYVDYCYEPNEYIRHAHIHYEKRVEEAQLKKELTLLQKRKRRKTISSLHEKDVIGEIKVEENLKKYFVINYNIANSTGKIEIPVSSPEEEVIHAFRKVYNACNKPII